MELYRKIVTENEYENIFYELFYSYNIKINKDYQFFYDEVFNHILEDTIKIINNNKFPRSSGFEYNSMTFKGQFYQHFSHSNLGDKLLNPDKYPELNNKLRKLKLKKLNINERY